jgi:hypothetical protein
MLLCFAVVAVAAAFLWWDISRGEQAIVFDPEG